MKIRHFWLPGRNDSIGVWVTNSVFQNLWGFFVGNFAVSSYAHFLYLFTGIDFFFTWGIWRETSLVNFFSGYFFRVFQFFQGHFFFRRRSIYFHSREVFLLSWDKKTLYYCIVMRLWNVVKFNALCHCFFGRRGRGAKMPGLLARGSRV